MLQSAKQLLNNQQELTEFIWWEGGLTVDRNVLRALIGLLMISFSVPGKALTWKHYLRCNGERFVVQGIEEGETRFVVRNKEEAKRIADGLGPASGFSGSLEFDGGTLIISGLTFEGAFDHRDKPHGIFVHYDVLGQTKLYWQRDRNVNQFWYWYLDNCEWIGKKKPCSVELFESMTKTKRVKN
jgi:hypothetical protein